MPHSCRARWFSHSEKKGAGDPSVGRIASAATTARQLPLQGCFSRGGAGAAGDPPSVVTPEVKGACCVVPGNCTTAATVSSFSWCWWLCEVAARRVLCRRSSSTVDWGGSRGWWTTAEGVSCIVLVASSLYASGCAQLCKACLCSVSGLINGVSRRQHQVHQTRGVGQWSKQGWANTSSKALFVSGFALLHEELALL